MNDNINRSDQDIPDILVEDYSASQTSHKNSGEKTPLSSQVGSLTSDELSVTSSQTSQRQKSHLSGRKLRSRLQALMRLKTDKQSQQKQQPSANVDNNSNELNTSSSTQTSDTYNGTKSLNYDAIPPLPKFNETSPEHNSENELKYVSGRADAPVDNNEEISEYEKITPQDYLRAVSSPACCSNKYGVTSINQLHPKHHADPMYEKHHIIFEGKALMNTTNTFTKYHGHHHHHHHHKTRSNKSLLNDPSKISQVDGYHSAGDKEKAKKNFPGDIFKHKHINNNIHIQT
ncbi:hypothetical protein MN116_003323 [Schistosoma mekongi]|uniref:Uncharacterized protein n=1 Tax=Schistosoma mekongi TaxID=38744 RepID=A0AAE2D762_SCHME|nr:hypothetical protein MN116_003323 [Schistosoma mekongi]